MRRIAHVIAAVAALAIPAAHAAGGLVTVPSSRAVAETMDRLQGAVEANGMKVFARIDHAAGATQVGAELRPTQLLIFGNPQGGTPLMQCQQSVGIDLPLKALVWEDADGKVWLGYNDPAYLAERHALGDCARPVVEKIGKALAKFAGAATAP